MPETILAEAQRLLPIIIAQEFGTVLATSHDVADSGDVFTLNDLRVKGSRPTVRLETVPLPGHQSARTFVNTISERNVIQLSDVLELQDLPTVLRHELAGLVAHRRRAQVAAVSPSQEERAEHGVPPRRTALIGDRERLPQRFQYPLPGRHDDGRLISRAELPQAVRRAAEERERRSAATLAEIRREASRLPPGVYPKFPIMIGAGAAVAARDPDRLLIDTRQRWHIDPSRGLVQSADQVSQLREVGMGDPYQFAAPRERLPLAALRLWEDTLANKGPLINGLARLQVDDRNKLVVRIRPADGSEPLTVEVQGEPLIATGIAPQALPGCSRIVPSVPDALNILGRYLSTARWADTPNLTQVFEELLDQEGAARSALDALKSAGLLSEFEKSNAHEVVEALQTLRATAGWDRCRQIAPGRVLLGDEVSDGRFDPNVAKTWIVAGRGGGGNTAPEIILENNRDARVSQLGGRVPDVLLNNAQFLELQRRYNRDFGGDGRLTVVSNVRLGAINMVEGRDGLPRFEEHGCQAEAYVACLGRVARLPRVLDAIYSAASTANTANRIPDPVLGELVFDAHRQYLGYRVLVAIGDVRHGFEITGAASRILPPNIFSAHDIRRVSQINLHEAPAESGNVAAGFMSTAMQAVRLEEHRARSGVRISVGAKGAAHVAGDSLESWARLRRRNYAAAARDGPAQTSTLATRYANLLLESGVPAAARLARDILSRVEFDQESPVADAFATRQLLLGRAYRALNDPERAIRELQHLLSQPEPTTSPTLRGRAFGELGNAYLDLGDPDQAVEALTQAARLLDASGRCDEADLARSAATQARVTAMQPSGGHAQGEFAYSLPAADHTLGRQSSRRSNDRAR